MSVLSLCDKTAAFLRRDFLTALRYRTGFVLSAAGMLVELAAFYFLSRAVGPGFRPEGLTYFPFLLVGTGFYTFMVMSVNAFVRGVQQAQQAGTLEALMTTATPAPLLILLSAASGFTGNTVQLVFYVGAGWLLFHGPFAGINVLGCVAIFGLSLVIAAAIGMIAAALQIAIQKGSAVVWLLSSGVWFLTGTLFPVASLPRPLRILSDVIPITHCLSGMRMALLRGAGFSLLRDEIGILALFCLLLLPASLLIFSYVLNRSRVLGTLSFY